MTETVHRRQGARQKTRGDNISEDLPSVTCDLLPTGRSHLAKVLEYRHQLGSKY